MGTDEQTPNQTSASAPQDAAYSDVVENRSSAVGMDTVARLQTLNEIATTLNRADDVRSALQAALERLIALMGLQTGWVFLRDSATVDKWWGKGYALVAYDALPPALDLDSRDAWLGNCACQGMSNRGEFTAAYNEVTCTRLADATGDRRGLAVHASAPLRSGERVLGILNVAAANGASFTPESLALLTNVGNLMGMALERARLADLLQERRFNEQAALLTLSNQLLSRPDLNDLMTYLVQETLHLLDADGAAILLPDATGQDLVFRASTGWQVDPVAAGWHIPIDGRTALGQVMQTQRAIFETDIRQSPRFAALPDWLRAEGFSGYVVMPLVADYRSIGVLLLNTRAPRHVSEGIDTRFLRLLANQTAIAIENTRLRMEEVSHQRLEEELAVGRRIQLTLLPRACPQVPDWEFAAVYQAAHQVGGDFYDFFELPGEPGRWGLVIADVADKGVPAALFMALARTTIRSASISERGPAEALLRANTLILEDSWSSMFLSVFYAVLDTRTGRLTYANGGHNHPLWWQQATGEITALSTQGIVVGLFEEIKIAEASIDLAPGDQVLFYTDGLTEAMNPMLEEFGEARLRAILAAKADLGAEQLTAEISGAVEYFAGNMQHNDDLTMFAVRRAPGARR